MSVSDEPNKIVKSYLVYYLSSTKIGAEASATVFRQLGQYGAAGVMDSVVGTVCVMLGEVNDQLSDDEGE